MLMASDIKNKCSSVPCLSSPVVNGEKMRLRHPMLCVFFSSLTVSVSSIRTITNAHLQNVLFHNSCLRLFCELVKMTERLVFDGERNKNNALQSYYTALTRVTIH